MVFIWVQHFLFESNHSSRHGLQVGKSYFFNNLLTFEWKQSHKQGEIAEAPFTNSLTLIHALISNSIHYQVCDDITYNPFPNLNGAAVEFWGWLSFLIPHFIGHMFTYPCLDQVNPS